MNAYILNLEAGTPLESDGYKFRSERNHVVWPRDDGRFLGAAGIWNFLFRLGISPEYLRSSEKISPLHGDLLFVISDYEVLLQADIEFLQRWLGMGGIVVAGGYLPAFRLLLPENVNVEQLRSVFPYAALGWKFGDNLPELVSPPLWSYGRLTPGGPMQAIGELVAVRGERQTPHRALITPLPGAPALIQYKNFIFLNGNPFGAFQAWLQGQEDLGPWLQWRHRLFWLDEQVAFLLRVLNDYGVLPRKLLPQSIAGFSDTTVVLRHDLDFSRDISYLNSELALGLPGVHAILKDRNTKFWVETLIDVHGQETGFHYTTARYNRLLEFVRSYIGLPKRSYRPDYDRIIGFGLLKQVLWAKKNRIGVATLHRHLPFIIYPEWVDALNHVFDVLPEVLGGSSLFRGQVLRWGCDRVDGKNGTCGDFPDAQFPYWFPFKLGHAGLHGRTLRGWETSSLMEIEPELFEQLLDHHVEGLPHRVFTINYHPAHTLRSTFCDRGSLFWWNKLLNIIRERDIEVRTLRDVFLASDNFATVQKQGIGVDVNGR